MKLTNRDVPRKRHRFFAYSWKKIIFKDNFFLHVCLNSDKLKTKSHRKKLLLVAKCLY